VKECEYNIRQFKKMYNIAKDMMEGEEKAVIQKLMSEQDAMGLLELLERRGL